MPRDGWFVNQKLHGYISTQHFCSSCDSPWNVQVDIPEPRFPLPYVSNYEISDLLQIGLHYLTAGRHASQCHDGIWYRRL